MLQHQSSGVSSVAASTFGSGGSGAAESEFDSSETVSESGTGIRQHRSSVRVLQYRNSVPVI